MNAKTNKPIKGQIIPVGYRVFFLQDHYKTTARYAHALVAAAFIGPRPFGYQINHKDAVKTNNHWTNLEYVTPQENVRHAIEMGLFNRAHASKLTADDVKQIREIGSTCTQRDLAKRFGVTQAHIGHILSGRRWKTV